MSQFFTWMTIVTVPLMLFLMGVTQEDNFPLYISYGMYIILALTGLVSYDKVVMLKFIERQRVEDILSEMPVPEWFNFLAKLISVITLVYYEREILGFFLLLGAYGNYRLFAKILPQVKVDKED